MRLLSAVCVLVVALATPLRAAQVPALKHRFLCQPLPDGKVLVAECFLSRIVEVGRDGNVAREIKIPSVAKVFSHQFRGTRKTADAAM